MNESRLCTIAQIEEFLVSSAQVGFSAHGDDTQRYEHISRVLKRFDYPRRVGADSKLSHRADRILSRG